MFLDSSDEKLQKMITSHVHLPQLHPYKLPSHLSTFKPHQVFAQFAEASKSQLPFLVPYLDLEKSHSGRRRELR
jgi:hypothetical protein